MAWNTTWTEYAEPNITGMYDAFAYFNTVTGDIFGMGLMIAIYMILIMIFSKWGMKTSFLSSSFIMFALSSILRATGLIGDVVVMFFMVMTGFGMLMAYWSIK